MLNNKNTNESQPSFSENSCFLDKKENELESSEINSNNYQYTDFEGFANFLTHFICVPGAIFAVHDLFNAARSTRHLLIVLLYGIFLIMLFVVSTVYHFIYFLELRHKCSDLCYKLRFWRKFLLELDRSTIYLFIAACYTPWLLLRDLGQLGTRLCQAIWITSFIGIICQQTKIITHPGFIIGLNLIIGIIPGTIMIAFMTDTSGLSYILYSGIFYLIGLLFFFSDGRIPLAHAIWHCCVNVGAYLHYVALRDYLINRPLPLFQKILIYLKAFF